MRKTNSRFLPRRLIPPLTCVMFLVLPIQAQFDWGGAAGRGTFEQTIKQNDIVDVGGIPEGLQEVAIYLSSDEDVDIQLYDEATGAKLVAWPDGLVHGPNRQQLTYRGMTIVYSGYNGDGRGLGREYILITTATTRQLAMKAYGYRAGAATVSYRWGQLGGSGAFQQQIRQQAIVDVGEIPPGLENTEIFLKSENDVDIQLHDPATGTEIVAWPNGLLSGPGYQRITYRGVEIEYSGYNGYHGNWGHEFIIIRNRTNRTLLMKAYGYRAGFARVNYRWGTGWIENSEAFVAPIRFIDGSPDPAWLEPLLGLPGAIASEVPFKLAELLVGQGNVGRFFLGSLNYLLTILDVIPTVGGNLQMRNELLLVRNGEWIERHAGSYRIREDEPVTVVAVTYAAGDLQNFPPIITQYAKNLELKEINENTWTELPILTDEEADRMSQYAVVPKSQLRLDRGSYWLRWGNKTVYLIVEQE